MVPVLLLNTASGGSLNVALPGSKGPLMKFLSMNELSTFTVYDVSSARIHAKLSSSLPSAYSTATKVAVQVPWIFLRRSDREVRGNQEPCKEKG